MPGVADLLRLGAPPERAKAVCVFVHGRGQSPEEMAEAVLSRVSAADVAFALPRAGAQTWYAARAVDPLTPQTREELGTSRGDLARVLSELRAEAPGRPLVLAGFSQGACLSLELAFAGGTAPDALVAFTGCRVGAAGDERPAALPAGLPVYLSAGSDDPWIPVAAFAEAAAELGRAGAALRADVFPGRPHEVGGAEIAVLEATLADLAAGRRPGFGAAR